MKSRNPFHLNKDIIKKILWLSLASLPLKALILVLTPTTLMAAPSERTEKCIQGLHQYADKLAANPALAFISDLDGDPSTANDPNAPIYGSYQLVYHVLDVDSDEFSYPNDETVKIATSEKIRDNRGGTPRITELTEPKKPYPKHEKVRMLSTHRIREAILQAMAQHPDQCLQLKRISIPYHFPGSNLKGEEVFIGTMNLEDLPYRGFPVGLFTADPAHSSWRFRYFVNATSGYKPNTIGATHMPTGYCYNSEDLEKIVSCGDPLSSGLQVLSSNPNFNPKQYKREQRQENRRVRGENWLSNISQ